MTCRYSTKPRPTADTKPNDIVTYRYNGQLVYVPVAADYDKALSHARAVFPQLKGLCDASLSLSMPGHNEKLVGISALAWPKLIPHIARYQIIDVQVTSTPERRVSIPNITITYADADAENVQETEPAPPYSGEDVVEDEKASQPSPRSLPATLHSKRSWLFQRLHGQ